MFSFVDKASEQASPHSWLLKASQKENHWLLRLDQQVLPPLVVKTPLNGKLTSQTPSESSFRPLSAHETTRPLPSKSPRSLRQHSAQALPGISSSGWKVKHLDIRT